MAIARRFPTLAPGSPKAVLDAAAQAAPELTIEMRNAAADALVARARPVTRVDTTTPLKEVVSADGISVTGSVESMRAVRVEAKPDGGWQILIDVSEAPSRRFRR